MKYPFVPKSTAYIEEGQLISVPLSNGKYACATVLELKYNNDKKDRTQIIIGLLNWCGNEPPNSESICGFQILDHGQVHIKTIKETGSLVVGIAPSYEIPLTLDSSPGPNCYLRQGYKLKGLATDSQQQTLEVFSTWGFKMLKIRAENQFV